MTVTITWKVLILGFVALCGGFTTVFVAASNFIKVVKAVKKPGESVKAHFEIYDKRIKDDHDDIRELRKQFAFMLKALPILLQDDLIILNHLRTDNNTGKMEKQEEKLNDFLLNRE